jgi:predicted phage baseplate assembly protein
MGDDYTSGPEAMDYTFDDGNWTRVVGYIDAELTYVHRDYAAGMGLSLLFGDGEFGLVPVRGAVFEVEYRLGGGNVSNVAAKVITKFDPKVKPGVVQSVINPLAAIDGMDPQEADEVRQLAPQAYQAVTYRAVRPPDYAAAGELLPWVQKAGCQFRWTGSWISAFVTADPEGQIGMSPDEVRDLDNQEERYRQAGREVIITQPVYANLDMEIEVCARPDAYAGEVQQRLMTALFGSAGYPPVEGFFSPDRFTFGTLLQRSVLETAIQEVPGVLAVEWIRYRRRGFFGWKFFTDYSYDPGKESIICIANDPLHPEEGILTLNIHGGL